MVLVFRRSCIRMRSCSPPSGLRGGKMQGLEFEKKSTRKVGRFSQLARYCPVPVVFETRFRGRRTNEESWHSLSTKSRRSSRHSSFLSQRPLAALRTLREELHERQRAKSTKKRTFTNEEKEREERAGRENDETRENREE
jgi:hypothetical protein